MPNLEQGNTSSEGRERRLVFDEKENKWRMGNVMENGEVKVNRGGRRQGKSISTSRKGSPRSEGMRRYWQGRRETGNVSHSPQHSANIREGVKRYWQKRREQRQ
jgi:hypothetical protein